MKIKIFISLAIFIFACLPSISIAQVTFQKMYGGNTALNSGVIHHQTFDGGYILAGLTIAFGAGDFDLWVIKLEQDGDIEWSKTYGGVGGDGVQYIQQTSDSGFIIAASTFSFGNNEMLLIKTDLYGNINWSKAYDGFGGNSIKVVKQTNDGGYILAGSGFSSGIGGYDYFIIKTNSFGDIIWQNAFGGPNADLLSSCEFTADGGYALGGTTFSFGGGYEDYYLVKTDSLGNMQWSKTFGSLKYEFCYSMKQVSDFGFVLCGYVNDNGFGDRVILLVKTNSIGDTLWTKTYLGTGDVKAYSIDETVDNGLIITGELYVSATTGQNIFLLKTDSLGEKQWAKSYGTNIYNYAYSVKQVSDNGYTVLGRTYLTGGMDERMYFIKTDVLGNSGCFDYNTPFTILPFQLSVQQPNTQTAQPFFQSTIVNVDTSSGAIYYTNCSSVGLNDDLHEKNIKIYPNPGKDIIILEFEETAFDGTIKMYNYIGKNVLNKKGSVDRIEIVDISELPIGIYLIEVNTGKHVKYGKIVKVD